MGKTLILGKIEGGRRRGRQRMKWLDGINDSMDEQTLGDSEGQGSLACSTWGSQKVRHDLATEQQKYVCIGENSIYGVWYSLRLQASTEGLRTYTPCIRGNYFIYFLYLFLFFYIFLMHCEL